MINVLPPQSKSQLKYARYNSHLMRYLLVILAITSCLVSLFFVSLIYANKQITNYQKLLSDRQTQRQSYQEIETKVGLLQSNLGLINSLLTEKTHYSKLLDDLASVLPPQSFITSLHLSGDDTKPAELLVSTDSFNRAAAVRNGLIQSKRIESADIQSVSRNEEDDNYTVVLVLAFAKGAAR